jgi:prevent-host-death family protein
MYISVTDAKAQLTDLVRRAEAGEEVILTRHGHAAVRFVPVVAKLTVEEKRKRVREIVESAQAKLAANPQSYASAARSADFLYGDDGLPK